jgi:hypothetical protein
MKEKKKRRKEEDECKTGNIRGKRGRRIDTWWRNYNF